MGNAFLKSFLLLSLLASCARPPEMSPVPESIHLSKTSALQSEDAPRALWFTTTNYSTGGQLGRIDLLDGTLRTNLLTVGSDSEIFADAHNGSIILNRMNHDSITIVSGKKASVTSYLALQERSNPQSVARDALGRLWVTSLESNKVQIFSADLKSNIGNIDLTSLNQLKNGNSPLVGLGEVISLNENFMAVTSPRLFRAGGWLPDSQSALAIIDIHHLSVVHSEFLPLSNPTNLSFDAQKQEIHLVGKGDLSPNHQEGDKGKFLTYSLNEKKILTIESFDGRILAASYPAYIVWYPSLAKSCIYLRDKKLTCEGNLENQGYVFSKILLGGGKIYVAYQGMQSSEIWIINPEPLEIQKVPLPLAIFSSLSFGV